MNPAASRSRVLFEAALDYARQGWPVFPARQNKKPHLTAYQYEATTDPAVLRSWWARWWFANPAILTGDRSGLCVIDSDQRNIEDRAAVDALLQPLPETRTHVSASGEGNEHRLFHCPVGLETGTVRGVPGVDVLANGNWGSYVLMPPSVAKNGNVYRVARDLPIASLPGWFLELVVPKGAGERTQSRAWESTEAFDWFPELLRCLMSRKGSRRGDEVTFLCPFHDDRNSPNGTLNLAKGCGRCFACDARYHWRKLADALGLEIPTNSPFLVKMGNTRRLIESLPWPGVAGASERAIVLAHVDAATLARRDSGYHASTRWIALSAGTTTTTVCRRQRAMLKRKEWLRLHLRAKGLAAPRDTHGDHSAVDRRAATFASTWSIEIPARYQGRASHTQITTPPSRGVCEVFPISHDAFRWRALGKNGPMLLQHLSTGAWSASALAKAARMNPKSVKLSLERKHAPSGAAVRLEHGLWTRGPATLDEIALHFETFGKGGADEVRFARERAAYRAKIERGDSRRLELEPINPSTEMDADEEAAALIRRWLRLPADETSKRAA